MTEKICCDAVRRMLRTEVLTGTAQVLLFHPGQWLFGRCRPEWALPLRVFRVRGRRWLPGLLRCGVFRQGERTFCSLLGLSQQETGAALRRLSLLLSPGSSVAFQGNVPDLDALGFLIYDHWEGTGVSLAVRW